MPEVKSYLVIVVQIWKSEVWVQAAAEDDFQQRLVLIRRHLTGLQKILKPGAKTDVTVTSVRVNRVGMENDNKT